MRHKTGRTLETFEFATASPQRWSDFNNKYLRRTNPSRLMKHHSKNYFKLELDGTTPAQLREAQMSSPARFKHFCISTLKLKQRKETEMNLKITLRLILFGRKIQVTGVEVVNPKKPSESRTGNTKFSHQGMNLEQRQKTSKSPEKKKTQTYSMVFKKKSKSRQKTDISFYFSKNKISPKKKRKSEEI